MIIYLHQDNEVTLIEWAEQIINTKNIKEYMNHQRSTLSN